MPDALSVIGTRITPQTQPADERQVQNSAGGYSFEAPQMARLHRFLTLGTEGGTYYVREPDLTRKAAGLVVQMAGQGDPALVDETVAISQAGRAPRNNPALFALAAAGSLGPVEARRKALDSLPLVARTGSHLLTFVAYAEQFRGWGPALCKAVGRWYTSREASEAAYQILKYKQRGGWSQRDVLRLCHFGRAPVGLVHKALFEHVIHGRELPELDALPLVNAAALAHATRDVREWVRLIGTNRSLSWEMLPSEALAEAGVWVALIESGLPVGALIRNLGRLTTLGVLAPMSAITDTVAARLAGPEHLRKARIHPVNVLVALRTYASGHGARGQGTWTPVPKVTDALDAAFYAAYGAVEPSGKRTMLALDVSGSMTAPVSGLPLSCREASAALALVTAATEPQHVITGFTGGSGPSRWGARYGSGISALNISPRQRLDDATSAIARLPFGGTDCALPMLWALENKIAVDTFQVYTDNETWAGDIHPHQALEMYRQQAGIPARLAVAAFTATEFTIADPADPGSLDVSGFDSAVPALLADFSRGDI